MKKIWKKFLAVTLALSMTMSMVSMTSLAAEEGNEETRLIYCDKKEHTHSIENGCYQLICTDEAEEHTHSIENKCYQLICTTGEHTHSEGCYTVPECTCTAMCGASVNENCRLCKVTPDACVGKVIQSIAVTAVYAGTTYEKKAQEAIENYNTLGITMPSLVNGWAQIDSTDFVDGKVTLLFCLHVQGTKGTPYFVTCDDSTWVGGDPIKGNLPIMPTDKIYGVDIFVTKTFSKSDIVTNDYGDWLGSQATVVAHQQDEASSGEWDWVRVNTKVTLTYDANAGDDEVTGLPVAAGDTVKKGEQVTIKSYRDMKREGYHILGWSVHADATWPDNDLGPGNRYTLNEDTTFYAVWEKNQDQNPDPEIPEGATLQTVKIMPSFFVRQGTQYSGMTVIPEVQYDYSYEYGGQTYTGTTTFEKLPFGVSNNQILKVLVADDGMPTMVNLTLKNHEVSGYTWFQQQVNYTANGWESVSKTTEATMNVTKSETNQIISVLSYNYYHVDEDDPKDETVTNREVKVVVSFETADHKAVTLDKVPENYAVTYSYVDEEGMTVTKTLERKDAEVTERPRTIIELQDGKYVVLGQDTENPYYYFEWTIEVPVMGEGSYLTLTQSNYEITETPYVWSDVAGVQKVGPDGDSIGEWYISKGNNPAYTYIYNIYAKEFTVTYTDGVEGSEVFADQIIKAKEGDTTPTFDGTPARENYTFTGWDPEVAETVTGDVTYVAQWRSNYVAPTYYTLTINYVDGEGNAVADTYTRDLREGRSYSVTSPTVEGMTPDQATVSGILTGNTTLTVTYSEDLDETDTPTTESPEPTESPEVTETPAPTESPEESEDLGDNDTPLTELPEETETPEPTESQEPEEGEDLGDNDTPLAEVPQTGDMLWLWMTLAIGSAVSLAWISAEEKKGKRVSK